MEDLYTICPVCGAEHYGRGPHSECAPYYNREFQRPQPVKIPRELIEDMDDEPPY